MTLTERFWSKVDKSGDCWIWKASIYKRAGYGQFMLPDQRNTNAHRVAWELTNGPIPDGLWVLHRCDVRACVNPAHLFLGTCKDNIHDMIAKGRARHWLAGRTHCRNGHEYTPENTYSTQRQPRNCKTCRRETLKRYDSRASRKKVAA